MFESGLSRSSPSCVDTPPTPLFHPKPVSFARPPLISSYSSPILPSPSSQPSPPRLGPMSSSASSSPSPPSPGKPSHSHSNPLAGKHRSKLHMPKKTSSVNTNKVKTVQVSLEVKVERSRGFHAFFVPLARGMPPAPPSSPVFGQSANADHHDDDARHDKSTSEERWVEDVGQRMDIDA